MCRLARCTTFLQTPNQLASPHTRMSLQLENRWREDTHHYVRWSEDSRQVIRLYIPRLQQQLVLTPRCGHLKGNGGVKGAVRFAQRLTNHYDYVARFDIRHYYESIDHRVMLAQLRHVSPDVFDVVQDYLCVPDRRRTGKGMVARGAISPLLGGLYLTPLAACRTCVTNASESLRCFTKDGSRSPEVGLQELTSNHPVLLRTKGAVVSDCGKGIVKDVR